MRTVPNSFKLFNRTYVIRPLEGKVEKELSEYGLFFPDTGDIAINPDMPLDKQVNVFFHELVHAILDALDENELGDNEQFVTGFAGLLAQYERTKRGNFAKARGLPPKAGGVH